MHAQKVAAAAAGHSHMSPILGGGGPAGAGNGVTMVHQALEVMESHHRCMDITVTCLRAHLLELVILPRNKEWLLLPFSPLQEVLDTI